MSLIVVITFVILRLKIYQYSVFKVQTCLTALAVIRNQKYFWSLIAVKAFFLFITRQPPILPYRCQYSTFGRFGLNRRVRDGNGCFPKAHRHRKCYVVFCQRFRSLWQLDSNTTPYFIPSSFLRKEVIQPQVLLRLPCYDFTPVIRPAFDGSLLAVKSPASGISDSHGVTGGVYKTRERIHRSMLICDY